jgi:hypothetical protein
MPSSAPHDRKGDYVSQRWKQADGNDLAITVDTRTGKVVYVELDWNSTEKAADPGVAGLTFGKTNLREVRRRFGNNGFSYSAMAFLPLDGGGLAMMNSFEIERRGGVVFTTVTKITAERGEAAAKATGKVEPGQISTMALLDAVILADPTYLDTIWKKDRIYDDAYRPVAWPTAAAAP